MTNREEYLEKLKSKLDDWNADIDKLETRAQEAQGEIQGQIRKQLATLREMRDDAQKQYLELQNAAADAWDVMVEGTEKAWKAWFGAFEDARSKFKPKD